MLRSASVQKPSIPCQPEAVSRFLANENVPVAALTAARQAGIEVASIREEAPGIVDSEVLRRAQTAGQVLVTFDKDFGELAFRAGRDATHGVILLRPRLGSPESVAAFLVKVLQQPIPWEGHFSVADESQIRVLPLPASGGQP